LEVTSQMQALPQNINLNYGRNLNQAKMNEQPILPDQIKRQDEVSQQHAGSVQDVPHLTARLERHQQPGGSTGSLPSLRLRLKHRPVLYQQGNRKPASRNEDMVKTRTIRRNRDHTKPSQHKTHDVEGGKYDLAEKSEAKEKHMLTRQRLNGIYSRI